MSNFSAGAGRAPIVFPEGYFPQHEGISRIYRDVNARTLLLDGDTRVCLVSVELPSVRPFELMDGLRKAAADITGTPFENVWVCMTHSLSAPHTPPESDEFRFNAHLKAVEDAIKAACTEAKNKLRPARFGYGIGSSALQASRDIESVDGWWTGLEGKDEVDNTLSLMKFEGTDGNPIAMVYNHGLKSCVMEATVMSDGFRRGGPDLCGEGSAIAEENFGCPVLFFMGAGGDQFPRKMGHYQRVGEDGHLETVNAGEEAYGYLAELGGILGTDIINLAEDINCTETNPRLMAGRFDFTAKGQVTYDYAVNPAPPVKYWPYPEAPDQNVRVELITIGECAIVGTKSEVTSPIWHEMRALSPFRNTMSFTMVNGGQSYIPDAREYDRYEFCAIRTPLARGTDRTFLSLSAQHLKEMAEKY